MTVRRAIYSQLREKKKEQNQSAHRQITLTISILMGNRKVSKQN